jgi:hypothetical protein
MQSAAPGGFYILTHFAPNTSQPYLSARLTSGENRRRQQNAPAAILNPHAFEVWPEADEKCAVIRVIDVWIKAQLRSKI